MEATKEERKVTLLAVIKDYPLVFVAAWELNCNELISWDTLFLLMLKRGGELLEFELSCNILISCAVFDSFAKMILLLN